MEKHTNLDQWHANETSKWDAQAAQILRAKRAANPTSTTLNTPSRVPKSRHDTVEPTAAETSNESEQVVVPATLETNATLEHSPETMSREQAYSLLGYADVLSKEDASASIESVRNSESGKNYADELITASQEMGSERLLAFTDRMHEMYSEKMNALGLPSSTWGESRSWILWDIAKQRYLAKHPDKSSSEYTSGRYDDISGGDAVDFTVNNNVVEEIIHRHIGWEYSVAPDKSLLKLSKLVQNGATEWLMRGERNSTNQLRSFELTRIGYFLIRKLELEKPGAIPIR